MEPDDPIIHEIRETRRRIQEQCGNDIHRMTLYFMEEQKKHADRLVRWEHPDEILDFAPTAAAPIPPSSPPDDSPAPR